MASCVAVVCAFWPQRITNIHTSVRALKKGTVQPDRIVIVNNNRNFNLHAADFGEGVEVINSSYNCTSRSKYPVALLFPADFYALLDDDVAVSSETLETFLFHAKPGYALCDIGVSATSNRISNGDTVSASEIRSPVKVDAFIGRFQLVSFGAIIRLLKAEEEVRIPNLPLYGSVGEDILVAACNPDAYVIPLERKSAIVDIEQGESAMQHDYGYYEFRDLFNYQMRECLGLPLSDDDIPGLSADDQNAIRLYLEKVYARDLGRLGDC